MTAILAGKMTEADKFCRAHGSGTGDAGVAWKGKAQRAVHGVANANAWRNKDLRNGKVVVAELKRRAGVEEVETVVAQAGEAEGLREAAGSGGELPGRHAGRESTVGGHAVQAENGLQGAKKNAAGKAF